MGYTTSYFPLIVLGYRLDSNRSYGSRGQLGPITGAVIGSFQFLPTGLDGLCFGCCFSGPLPLCSLINSPPIGIRFRESLVIRLYLDQIHLSIEAQCVTTLLPLGDCHNLTSYDFLRFTQQSYDQIYFEYISIHFNLQAFLYPVNRKKTSILFHLEKDPCFMLNWISMGNIHRFK